MLIYVLTVLISHSPAQAGECFARTFCAMGSAPKYILCSRGQDCANAPDLGLQFRSDCTMAAWRGDAQETRKYEVVGTKVTVLPNAWTSGGQKENYRLSRDGKKLVSNETKHTFSAEACSRR